MDNPTVIYVGIAVLVVIVILWRMSRRTKFETQEGVQNFQFAPVRGNRWGYLSQSPGNGQVTPTSVQFVPGVGVKIGYDYQNAAYTAEYAITPGAPGQTNAFTRTSPPDYADIPSGWLDDTPFDIEGRHYDATLYFMFNLARKAYKADPEVTVRRDSAGNIIAISYRGDLHTKWEDAGDAYILYFTSRISAPLTRAN